MSGHKRQKYRVTHGGQLSANYHGQAEVNVGESERQYSLLGGAALAVCGLLRGSACGLAMTAIGGGLIYRGLTGHCHLYEALGHSSANEGGDERGRGRANERHEAAAAV